MWNDFRNDEKSLVFTFDRRPPFGDLRVDSDDRMLPRGISWMTSMAPSCF